MIKPFFKKTISIIPLIIVLALSVPIVGVAVGESAKTLGYKKVTVEVMGTGSMYPSLYWDKSEGGPEDSVHSGIAEYRSSPLMYHFGPGIFLLGNNYFHRTISYGDMVAFRNLATEKILSTDGKDTKVGFIKRVIGLPGDTIELRDGYVIKNGELLEEPYIYKPRSTYGNSGLPDCQLLTIPADHYFVLGDNRKVSLDSRSELGLIASADISYLLPYDDQAVYRALWRDPQNDGKLSGTPTIDKVEFYALLNQIRKSSGQKSLIPTPALAKSAGYRGERLLTNQHTTYSLQDALAAAGYQNSLVGEFVTYGHFSASELIQNLLAFGNTSKQIKNSAYQEIGLTATTKEIAGCPTQVIVGHLGGYVPPEYSQSMLDNWQSLSDNLASVIPTWEKAVGYNNLDQSKLTELLTLLRRRKSLAEEILVTIKNKAWLTDDQEARIKQDNVDADQAEILAKDLNQP